MRDTFPFLHNTKCVLVSWSPTLHVNQCLTNIVGNVNVNKFINKANILLTKS